MKPLVLGSITGNLKWDQCKLWVNSLNKSGYQGDKIIIIFGENVDLYNKFTENGFEVFTFRELEQQEHICVVRFFIYYAILSQRNNDYVIATDVMDVVFQKNPVEFFERLPPHPLKIIASSENILYGNEAWGANNVRLAFGDAGYNKVKDREIYNAGVMAGPLTLMADLYFTAYSMCEGKPQHVPGGGGSDQAAYNLLLSTEQYIQNTYFVSHDQGWACQVGTVADPHKNYTMFNLDPNPMVNTETNTVVTSKGVDYFIVHQYNRNPMMKQMMENKYND